MRSQESVQPVRVVIADDHPVYREGLAGLIDTEEGLAVVGRASNGHEAIALVDSLEPDLLVLDLDMPELDGISALREISARTPGTAVLVLTMYGDDDAVFEAIKAGARGYLVKSADPDNVLRAVRTVADGGVMLSAALGERMSDWFTTLQRKHGPLSHLTPREREVLTLMTKGRDNASIARLLQISPKTVRNVVSAV
ncbi:MAG TPA: response regulator transcription factor, partial [Actinomycetota bacterium]|nr:response regulator transcription factor [Actinomycetota bacterium]